MDTQSLAAAVLEPPDVPVAADGREVGRPAARDLLP
jgi:hypothetical protein